MSCGCASTPPFHAGPRGPRGPPAGPWRHPRGRHQPRWAGHLPRPRAGGGLSARRSAACRLLREGIRPPRGRGRDPHARAFRRHGPPRGRRAGHLRAAGRSAQPRPAAPAPAEGRPAGARGGRARLHRAGQDRRARHQGFAPLHLPRRGTQRGHGPGTLLAHQPLRLRRVADRGPFYNRRAHHLGRSGFRAGQPIGHPPRAPDLSTSHEHSRSRARSAIHRRLQPARQAEGRREAFPHPHQGGAGRGAEETRVDPRQGRLAHHAFLRDQGRSCASTSCTRCARRPRAPTSASASARARPRS